MRCCKHPSPCDPPTPAPPRKGEGESSMRDVRKRSRDNIAKAYREETEGVAPTCPRPKLAEYRQK